jgi:hypothetical protein
VQSVIIREYHKHQPACAGFPVGLSKRDGELPFQQDNSGELYVAWFVHSYVAQDQRPRSQVIGGGL